MKREIKLLRNKIGDSIEFDISDERLKEIWEQFNSITWSEWVDPEVAIKVFSDLDLTDTEYTLLILNTWKVIWKWAWKIYF